METMTNIGGGRYGVLGGPFFGSALSLRSGATAIAHRDRSRKPGPFADPAHDVAPCLGCRLIS